MSRHGHRKLLLTHSYNGHSASASEIHSILGYEVLLKEDRPKLPSVVLVPTKFIGYDQLSRGAVHRHGEPHISIGRYGFDLRSLRVQPKKSKHSFHVKWWRYVHTVSTASVRAGASSRSTTVAISTSPPSWHQIRTRSVSPGKTTPANRAV